MSGRIVKGRKATNKSESSNARDIYAILEREFWHIHQCDLDETAFGALDRILDLGESDLFYCEATCLSYAAHALTLENGPKEVWIISNNDGSYAFPRGEDERQVEEMAERGRRVAKAVCAGYPNFKGFANVPPDGPYKMLITAEYAADVPDALCWPEMSSYFHHQLDVANGSIGAIIYPSLDKQPAVQSLREGVLIGESISWAVELSGGRVVLGFGGGNGACHMVDLSDPEYPWEIVASPFMVAACGGCLVPSMCRKCADTIEEASLGGLATRISRGTSLSRKALNPKSWLDAHRGKILWKAGEVEPESSFLYDCRYGFTVREGDHLFLDSSCINSVQVEPLFIDEIPKGQERYTVTPEDGEVLLVSRNEKSFVFYKAEARTLIANSVYIVWLNSDVNTRYLECWLEGSYAKRWLKTAGKMPVDPRNPEPILSKGTLSSLPVPIMEEKIVAKTVSRKNVILHRIQELYSQIAELESRESFAPASAMVGSIENTTVAN